MDPFTAVDDQLPTTPDREDELSGGEAGLLAAQVFDARPVTSRTSRRFEPTRVPAPSTKVLIVSHDPERCAHLCDLLERQREVQRVEHVERDWRALERVDEVHPDMVVLDLPDHLSGIELVPKLRRRAPRSTIVVTSAAASRAAAPAATALGATCYVQHARKRGVRRLAAVLARLAQSSANRPVAPI